MNYPEFPDNSPFLHFFSVYVKRFIHRMPFLSNHHYPTRLIMKQAILILASVFAATLTYSQEFSRRPNSNGLIYGDTTMTRLRFVVDSIHLKFKHCDLDRTYYSICQTQAHYINLDTGDIQQAFADIQRGASFEEFIKKNPLSKVDSTILLTITAEESNSHQRFQYYNNEFDEYEGFGIFDFPYEHLDSPSKTGSNEKWVFEYTPKTATYGGEIKAFYLLRAPVAR